MKFKFRYLTLALSLLAVLTGACKKEDKEPKEKPPIVFLTNEYCEDSCYFSEDGDCDDGGIGSTSDYCKFGTDCSDCGTRIVKTAKD